MRRLATISEKTAGAQKLAGYFNLYWDAKQGKLWLEIDKWSTEFLYQSGLSAGIGSNDIGLDRGQLGATRIVRFERSGPKILLVQENFDYRAVSDDPAEKRAVHDSFAESVLAGFTVAAEEKDHVLVDATDFFLRDAHDIPGTLTPTKQGILSSRSSRCAVYMPLTKNFPTQYGSRSHAYLRRRRARPVGQAGHPFAGSITVREHHSFVQLPPPGYKTRVYDPRSSFFGITYMDYGEPVHLTPIEYRLLATLVRHAGRVLTHRQLLRESGGRRMWKATTTCAFTWRICGRSSSAIRRSLSISLRRRASGTGWSGWLEAP